MKRIIRKIAASNVGWRLLGPRASHGLLVLMYHRIGEPGDVFPHFDVRDFRRQLLWLLEHCTIVSPDELPLSRTLPEVNRPRVVLTFDDGYRDYYEHAYPALRANGIPAINFLPTGFVDRPRLTWWERLFLAVRSTRMRVVQAPWDHGRAFELSDQGRAAFLRDCKIYLKSLPDADMEGALRRIWEVLDMNPDGIVLPRQTMNWHEVRATCDVTSYGGHTHKHPMLTRVDGTRAEWEIATCRRRLTEELGTAPRFFAYPVGDFNDSVKEIVRREGFDVAFSTVAGTNGSDTDWLAVKRVPAEAPVSEVAWAISRLTGLAGWIPAKRP